MPHKILVVDDEADIRAAIQGILEDEGYMAHVASSADEAIEMMTASLPDLIILDVWLKHGEHDGMELLSQIRKRYRHLPVLIMSGHGTIEMAVSAMKQGAYDFIEKPFQTDRMLMTITRALETSALRQENQALKEKVEGAATLIGQSPQIKAVRAAIERIAPSHTRVLLSGLPGTGKEVAARMIHRLSQRSSGPFVSFHIGLCNPDTLEQDLFGADGKIGVITKADGGTLYLDDIHELRIDIQKRLIQLLADMTYTHPVTGAQIEFDVRIVAATTEDLQGCVADQSFLPELYERLNTSLIDLPPLRARREDIPLFVEHFMTRCAHETGRILRALTPESLSALQAYDWPGNIRQVKNVAEWLVIMANGHDQMPIDIADLPPEMRAASSLHSTPSGVSVDMISLPLREAREVFERSYLQAQIARFEGSVSKTAQFVGMERSALHRKLKMLNVLTDTGEESDDSGLAPAPDSERNVA